MDHGISDANRQDLGLRCAAQEVVELRLASLPHAPSGQERQCRCTMTGIVAEAACTRVGSIQVIIQEVMLQFEHELQRQRGVSGIESCVEDADTHTITRWRPYECPRGCKLREVVAQVPGELL